MREIMTIWRGVIAMTALTSMPFLVQAGIDLSNYKPDNIEPMSREQLLRARKQIYAMEEKSLKQDSSTKRPSQNSRKLFDWSDMKFWDSSAQYKWVFEDGFNPYNETGYRYARSDVQYSKYAQAYRMLGGYIDCDHPKEQRSHDSHDGDGDTQTGCARWMMWAAYVRRGYSSKNEGGSGSGSGDRSGDKDRRKLEEDEYDYDYEDEEEDGNEYYGDVDDYYGDADAQDDYGYSNNNNNETEGYYNNYFKAANDDNGYYNYGSTNDDMYQMRDSEMMNYYGNKNENSQRSGGGLDCGEQGSSWRLLGVYRQEFYQYYEQISKHLWAIDDANYIVALAGLSYMTDSDCQYVGVNYKGKSLYAAPEPLYGGYFQMGIYTDPYCVTLDNSGYTYDDFYPQTELDLNCEDNDDGNLCSNRRKLENDDGNAYYDDYNSYYDYNYNSEHSYYNSSKNSNSTDDENTAAYESFDFTVSSVSEAYEIWNSTQEYTMTNFNQVYETFMSCTACMDYPTYQDGFFNGNSGYEDDDLINQCWKFYSHSSYTCNGECQYFAMDQGTVNPPLYSDAYSSSKKQSSSSSSSSSGGSSSSSSGGSDSAQDSGSQYKYKQGQVTRLFLETEDRDQFLSNTFFLSSTIIFLASFATYLFMGGTTTTLKNDMLEKECCADETYLPEDELVSPSELMIDNDDDIKDYYSRAPETDTQKTNSKKKVAEPEPEDDSEDEDETEATSTADSLKQKSPRTPRNVRIRRSRGRSATPRSESASDELLDNDDKVEGLVGAPKESSPVIPEAASGASDSSRDENYYHPPKPLY